MMHNASLNNQSTFVDYSEDYETSLYMQVITGVFYSMSFVLGVVSNILVREILRIYIRYASSSASSM